MKYTIATLIAGLFATAAFAQTPATAPAPAPTAAVPAAKVEAKVDAKVEAKSEAKVEHKHVKAKKKHGAKTEAAHETTFAAATTPAPAK